MPHKGDPPVVHIVDATDGTCNSPLPVICEWCGRVCSSLSGNPSAWPMVWANPDGTGRTFNIHVGCLQKKVLGLERALDRACAYIAKAAEIVHIDDVKRTKNCNPDNWREYFLNEVE